VSQRQPDAEGSVLFGGAVATHLEDTMQTAPQTGKMQRMKGPHGEGISRRGEVAWQAEIWQPA